MTTLLQALLRNESGGRNIPNVHQGTSSGQAQGYFQITTGTWKEFARKAGIDLNRYPTPMRAADGSAVPYSVQAQVASVIPLRRWDESTVASMRGTGRRVDRNRTLGENLGMNGENFTDFAGGGGGGSDVAAASSKYPLRHAGGAGSSDKSFISNPGGGNIKHVGGAGSGPGYFAPINEPGPDYGGAGGEPAMYPLPPEASLADMLAGTVSGRGGGGGVDLSQTGGVVGDDTGGALPTLDYASAVPPAGPPPPAVDLSPLAQLFQLKNIGQAPAIQQMAPFKGF